MRAGARAVRRRDGPGRVREGPVGPHPRRICRLASGPELSAGVMPWLALNRDGPVVFCHPETGDVIADHTRHAIWMGAGMEPDLAPLGG